MDYCIYRLDCAETGECLYVGATKQSVSARARHHRSKRSRVTKVVGNRAWFASEIERCPTPEAAERRETHWVGELRPLVNARLVRTGYSGRGGTPPTEAMLLARPKKHRRAGRAKENQFADAARRKLASGRDVADYELAALSRMAVIALIERGHMAAIVKFSARLRRNVYTITATEARRWLSGRGVIGF